MDKFTLIQFYTLVRRELWENRNLFIGAPVVLALLLLVATAWIVSFLPKEQIVTAVEYLAILFDGLSPAEMAPFFMLVAVPFMMTLYVCCLVYLVNTQYQDRRDMSIFFWQSILLMKLHSDSLNLYYCNELQLLTLVLLLSLQHLYSLCDLVI